jgi:hypothetical protein
VGGEYTFPSMTDPVVSNDVWRPLAQNHEFALFYDNTLDS